VLDAVDLDRTWLVLVADHGESWGERPGAEVRDVFDLHGNELSEEVLRVPLLIRPPGGTTGRRIGGLARTVDLLPTLAELLELGPAPDGIDGASLADCVRRGSDAAAADALSVGSGDFVNLARLPETADELWRAYALTTPRHKVVWKPRDSSRRAYDLVADPLESVDVSERDASMLAPLWRRLEAERSRAVVGAFGEEDMRRVAERLRALGYLE
jgi:arylsulfatase A-like enzyme